MSQLDGGRAVGAVSSPLAPVTLHASQRARAAADGCEVAAVADSDSCSFRAGRHCSTSHFGTTHGGGGECSQVSVARAPDSPSCQSGRVADHAAHTTPAGSACDTPTRHHQQQHQQQQQQQQVSGGGGGGGTHWSSDSVAASSAARPAHHSNALSLSHCVCDSSCVAGAGCRLTECAAASPLPTQCPEHTATAHVSHDHSNIQLGDGASAATPAGGAATGGGGAAAVAGGVIGRRVSRWWQWLVRRCRRARWQSGATGCSAGLLVDGAAAAAASAGAAAAAGGAGGVCAASCQSACAAARGQQTEDCEHCDHREPDDDGNLEMLGITDGWGTLQSAADGRRGAAAHLPPPASDLGSVIDKVKDCGWYWGPISRGAAERLVQSQPDGSFIVRDSGDDRYIFSLTFRLAGVVRHVRIEHDNGSFSFGGGHKFSSGTIGEFVASAVDHSQSGRFLFFLQRRPARGPARVQLLHPVSRFTHVQSLRHLVRFAILKLVRRDHIDLLPLPPPLLGYLKSPNYMAEQLDS